MATDAPTSATVLVVDDDQGLLRLIEKILGRAGCRAIGAVSGELALAALEQNSVDLVLLDLGLPNLDGRELARQLATRVPRVPFVVITGLVDVPTAVNLMRCGALDYVMKDAQFIDFLPSVIGRALAEVERDRRLAAAEEELRRFNIELEQRVRHRTAELEAANQQLQEALAQIQTLKGLLPTCAHCKDVRDASGEWHPIERYISQRSAVSFSHGLCPKCLRKHYPDIADDVLARIKSHHPPGPPAADGLAADGR
jgi:FixJ family two-component response regulator